MKKTLIVLIAILALVCSFAIAEGECTSHNWSPKQISKATCTEPAMWEETCTECGVSNGKYPQGSALGHNYVETKLTDANCTEAATYKKECTNGCGDSTVITKGSALGHKYVTKTVTAATCTAAATVKDVCDVCKVESAVRTEGKPAEHNWKIEEDNTICDVIKYTEKCTECGTINQVWTSGSGKKHNWETTYVDATCTTPKTYTEKCTKCGTVNQVWSEGDTIAHSFTKSEVIVKGDCVTDEMSQYICAVCGAKGEKFVSTPAPGHTAVVVPGYAATCTEKGLTDGSKCGVCGVELKAQEVIPATGHNYEKNRVVEPTETKKGYTEYKCEACGDWYRARYTAALGVVADAALAPYGEGIVTDLDDVAMPYTAEVVEEINRVTITATDKGVLRELHISLALIEQWKAEGIVEVEFIVDEAEIVVPFAVLETEMMEEVKAAFPATLTGYIVTLDPTAVNDNGVEGVLVKVDLTADTAEEDGIEMEVTDVIEGMKLAIGDAAAASVVGGGVYTA